MTAPVRLSVNLHHTTSAALNRYIERNGVNATEAVRRALALLTLGEEILHRDGADSDEFRAALGLEVEDTPYHFPRYGSFNDHRCGDPTEPCVSGVRRRVVGSHTWKKEA